MSQRSREAAILQHETTTARNGGRRGVAGRSLCAVADTGRVVDLATGDAVALTMTSAGGPAEQTRWATRCDTLHALRHRSIATLIDYGPVGEARRFEAWRCGPPWTGGRPRRRRPSNTDRRSCARAGCRPGILPWTPSGVRRTGRSSCRTLPPVMWRRSNERVDRSGRSTRAASLSPGGGWQRRWPNCFSRTPACGHARSRCGAPPALANRPSSWRSRVGLA